MCYMLCWTEILIYIVTLILGNPWFLLQCFPNQLNMEYQKITEYLNIFSTNGFV